jgi:hypothetical protein
MLPGRDGSTPSTFSKPRRNDCDREEGEEAEEVREERERADAARGERKN